MLPKKGLERKGERGINLRIRKKSRGETLRTSERLAAAETDRICTEP
jgi:hypothetical protein